MNIQIVMPEHNESDRILPVLKELQKQNYKVIVVDDGSTDKSNLLIKQAKLKNVVLLTHKINLGKGAALKTGSEYAFSHGADAVILMDSDGQHSVDDLKSFETQLKLNKYDVILGSRNLSHGVPLVRYLGNKIASIVVNIVYGIYVSDLISGYRAFTKNAYKKIKWDSNGYDVETEIIVRIKKNNLLYCEIPVATIYYDNYKGVSILDSISVLLNLIVWKFKI